MAVGFRQQKRGLFGSPPSPAMNAPDPTLYGGRMEMQQPNPALQQQGGGFKRVVGILADALAGAAGQPGPYLAMRQQQQEWERRKQWADQQRMAAREDKQWEWENEPQKPVNNDTVADYEFILKTLGPEAAKDFLANKANPPEYRQGPDGRFYRVDTANAPSVPTSPVGKLTPIQGGGAGNGTRPF